MNAAYLTDWTNAVKDRIEYDWVGAARIIILNDQSGPEVPIKMYLSSRSSLKKKHKKSCGLRNQIQNQKETSFFGFFFSY